MKELSIKLIKIYKKIPGPWHNNCRFTPTCSEYTIKALEEYGFIKGWSLGIKRIMKCNPWGSYGYDPVPVKRKKF